MSEHTKTPWEYSLETGEITSKHERGCEVVVEADGANPFDARHIVHCVNNHDRLVEALRKMVKAEVTITHDPHEMFARKHYAHQEARALLTELENQQ